MDNEIKVRFYGVRGTAVAAGRDKLEFGTNTSCVYACAKGRHIVFDCGTGLVGFSDFLTKSQGAANCKGDEKITIDIFISHVHLDHVIGLTGFKPLFMPQYNINIYSEERRGMSIKRQMDTLMRPPFWPIKSDAFLAKVNFITIKEDEIVRLDDETEVSSMRLNHPDTCTAFKLKCGKKNLVYALDYEHDDSSLERLGSFAEDCDLMIYDASYTEEDYEIFKGWGHSTWQKGIGLGESCGAKRVALSHLSPSKTDEELKKLQEEIRTYTKLDCFIAVEGEMIEL